MKKSMLLFMILVWGCAPYVVVGGKYVASLDSFEVELPAGWRKHELNFDPVARRMLDDLQTTRDLSWDAVRITRDGLMLQQIGMGRVFVEKELTHTKRKLLQGMIPQEASEVIADGIRSNPNLMNVKIIENNPATVGGYPGFKLTYVGLMKKGLPIKVTYYGAVVENWLYYLIYEAPERHYFAKDQAIFERVKDSFKIMGANKTP